MATTDFTDGVTLTAADWFNDVDRVVYDILGDPADDAAARTGLGLGTGDSPTFTSLTLTNILTALVSRAASSSQSCAHNTATTLFSISTNAPGLYVIVAYITDAGAANYTAFAFAVADGSQARIVNPTGGNGAALTLTLSTLAVQATQTSGTTQTVNYAYLRIA